MKKTRLRNLTEEIQDYVAANFVDESSGEVVYTVGENFTAENDLDLQDLDRIAGSTVLLTMFYDGGTLERTGGQTYQQASYRFVTKGTHAQGAMDRGRALLEWFEDKRTFETSHFRCWVSHTPKLPGVIGRNESGSFLADFVISVLAFSRV